MLGLLKSPFGDKLIATVNQPTKKRLSYHNGLIFKVLLASVHCLQIWQMVCQENCDADVWLFFGVYLNSHANYACHEAHYTLSGDKHVYRLDHDIRRSILSSYMIAFSQ